MQTQTKLLGIDPSAGKRYRATGRKQKTTQQNRLAVCKHRLKQARKVLGSRHRVAVIWKTGLLPAATFGHQVHGMCPAALRWLRGAAARLSHGGSQGAHTATLLALNPENDPGRDVLLGPVLRYAEELWDGIDPTFRTARHIPPGELTVGVNSS